MRIFYALTAVIVGLFVIAGGLKPSSYRWSRLEADRNVTRQEYYGQELGKVYKNRYGVFYFNRVYPFLTKLNFIFFSSVHGPYVYLPLYAVVLYVGFKRYR